MIATKFGLVPSDGYGGYVISGRPDYVRRACDASLKRLGTDHIDPYYQHRLDARKELAGVRRHIASRMQNLGGSRTRCLWSSCRAA